MMMMMMMMMMMQLRARVRCIMAAVHTYVCVHRLLLAGDVSVPT